jgi:predicted aminopeptidase
MLAEDEISRDTREFLLLAADIRRFAATRLGLKENRNYTKYIETEKGYIVDVVTACACDTFSSHTWWFPFFGAMPYKGFYEKKDAQAEIARLEHKDLDVYSWEAPAFSTVGILADPLYSHMSGYSVFTLASVLIHEQTHATVYLKNQSEFNEELAGFIGDEGALLYIREKWGPESKEYQKAESYKLDHETYINIIQDLHRCLDSMYKNVSVRGLRISLKDSIINSWRKKIEADYDSLFVSESFRGLAQREINNAYLQSAMTYFNDTHLFYRLYDRYNRDLPRTIDVLKMAGKHRRNPKEWLKELASGP